MYLSDRDISWAIAKGTLIIQPAPAKIDPTSIDLHLDRIDAAQIWDTEKLLARSKTAGTDELEIHLGTFRYQEFSRDYLTTPPDYVRGKFNDTVCRRGPQIIVRPNGFLLWQTKEVMGTPVDNAQFMCFVDGKSTKARAGIIVHLTAPTIHAGWSGKIVLEIANLGPLTFVLQEGDVIAQLTVATISSIPEISHIAAGSSTLGQVTVTGKPK
jgi:dCTP deaminase